MPILAAMLWTIQVGVKSVAQQPTGEWIDSFSYTGAASYPCRVYDGPVASFQRRFGVTLAIDAVAIVQSSAGILAIRLSTTTGDRQQVKITDAAGNATLWEVLYAGDLGNVGLYRELALKRWV
ncbi:MAG TPA: hypothetical protein VGX78_18560 [Pirellulales bacterium]|jgi:hypothetical protein|nr:hypothetical protein [Pirellulales bacterium]